MNHLPQLLIILPRIRIQNANTISSPLTWGFPSMTAILGFVHALERKLRINHDIKLEATGIVCHKFDPQVSGDYIKTFSLLRKPLKKDGSTAALVEEGRANLTISFVIKATGNACDIGEEAREIFADEIYSIAQTLRVAGGNILPPLYRSKRLKPQCEIWKKYSKEQLKASKKILQQLLPGVALLCREELLDEEVSKLQKTNSHSTKLDALLSLSSIKYFSTQKEDGSGEWNIEKKSGWIVPITIGYQAISQLYPAGSVDQARDATIPFQFVENIYSIGEWKWVHRIEHINEILWRYKSEDGLYRCVNQETTNQGERQ